MRVGLPVRIEDLKAAPEINGRTGVICGFKDDTQRWTVQIDATSSQPSFRGFFLSSNIKVIQSDCVDDSRTSSTSPSASARTHPAADHRTSPPPLPSADPVETKCREVELQRQMLLEQDKTQRLKEHEERNAATQAAESQLKLQEIQVARDAGASVAAANHPVTPPMQIPAHAADFDKKPTTVDIIEAAK
jgi:hypothetical protein